RRQGLLPRPRRDRLLRAGEALPVALVGLDGRRARHGDARRVEGQQARLPERQRARPRALHLHVPPRRHARVLDRDVAGRRAVGTVHHRALREQEEGRRLRKRRSRSMRHARLLVVVLVGALAAAAWWLLDSRATDAVDGASGVAALDPERDSAALRAGGDAEGDEEQATATERTALTVGNAPAAGEGAGPFGYVGHVVDAAGQPVAGATVYLTPWPVASWSGVDA